MAEGESHQKTEPPTQKKLRDTRKKGKVAHSKECVNFIMLGCYTGLLIWLVPSLLSGLCRDLFGLLDKSDQFFDLSFLLKEVGSDIVQLFALTTGSFMFVSALFSGFIQHGFVISTEVLSIDWSKISVLSGVKRLFSTQSIMELFNNVVKLSIISFAVFLVISDNMETFLQSYRLDTFSSALFVHAVLKDMFLKAMFCMFFIAILDLFYKKSHFYNSLKMTKEEVKRESRDSEGNPEIKSKRRSIRMSRAKAQLNKVVDADVVIVNPEHFAVALVYNKTMPAPKVVAKGQDYIALKIKQIAHENSIVVVTNKILARLLYKEVEIGQYIKEKFYRAVAEIIKYVYRMRNMQYTK